MQIDEFVRLELTKQEAMRLYNELHFLFKRDEVGITRDLRDLLYTKLWPTPIDGIGN